MSADLAWHVVLALVVVAVAGRVCGLAARLVGQPPVIGEVLSGVVLGPSVVGLLAPAAETYLFPEAVIAPLDIIAQTGVVLYMFLVGLEFDVELIALTVGLKAGLITPRLFTMMVIMAIVTTAMTAPLLDLVAEKRREQ